MSGRLAQLGSRAIPPKPLHICDLRATHGHCGRQKLQEMYAASHAVIVPTTAEFTEGFNQVVTEAVLAGRPVVTSDVCPAVEYLPGAVVLVPTDDVDAYERAVLRLCDDPAYYGPARASCGCR